MMAELQIRNRIIQIIFIVILTFTTQSCGRTFYIFGELTRSGYYTYSPDQVYNSDGGVNWIPKTGAQIGLSTNVAALNEKLNIRTEVNISLQGAKYEDLSDVRGNISLIYTYIPLILRYQSNAGFYGEAGFQPGLLISARDLQDGTATYYSDYIKKLDFGITGGIGYEFNNNISIGLRVFQGFSNISVAKYDGKSNQVIALRGAYALKKK